MKRILVSQRQDKVLGRNETRDALDVKWAKILFDLGFLPIPVCSELANEIGYIEELEPDAILLSGGNDIGQALKRDCLEYNLLDYAKKNKLPVLGVCRGMQMINHYCNGSVRPIEQHVATSHKIDGIWAENFGFEMVNSYHNLAIFADTLGSSLSILAQTEDNVIEALKHDSLPWVGIMWHPERELKLNKADKHFLEMFFNE